MTYTYVEDWDESKHGPFPVTSSRMRRLEKASRWPFVKVLLQDEDGGTWAGWRTRPERQIGKLTEDEDTRRTVPARYEAFAAITLSPQEEARRAASHAELEANMSAAQQAHNAKEALKSKRENGQALTPADLEFMADLLTGRV